jgi:hypothetical protein
MAKFAPEQLTPSTAHSMARYRHGPVGRQLLAIARVLRERDLTLGSLVDHMGEQGLGLLLLVLTLPTIIPAPGPFGMVFGAVVAFVALQIMCGADRLWLPARLRSRTVPRQLLRAVIRRALPLLSLSEPVLCEGRLSWLTGRRARMSLAVPLLVMAITIALPIPFGNLLPALALIVAASGLIARDGLVILVSIVVALLAVLWTLALLMFGAEILRTAAEATAALLANLPVSF